MEHRDKDMVNEVYGSEYRDLPKYGESSSKMTLKSTFAFLAFFLPLSACLLPFF